MIVECTSCGLTNRANSKFCKKCGGPLDLKGSATEVAVQGIPSESLNSSHTEKESNQRFHTESSANPFSAGTRQAIEYQPQTFTPSGQTLQTAGTAAGRQQMYIGVMAALVATIIIGGAIISSKNSDKSADASSSSNSNFAPSVGNRAAIVINTNSNVVRAYNSRPDTSLIGREGRLLENTNLRSGSNRFAEIRGTHYQGATVRVLDVDSYSTPDGTSTWYRVEVIKDGCDAQGRYGCGNNWERNGYFGWMEAERFGWFNARFIALN